MYSGPTLSGAVFARPIPDFPDGTSRAVFHRKGILAGTGGIPQTFSTPLTVDASAPFAPD